MKNLTIPLFGLLVAIYGSPALFGETESKGDNVYSVVRTVKVGGAGGFDYVFADADERRLYIPRGNRVTVFDLDTLKPAGEIANTESVHGVAVDPASHHGFCSSKPVVMWDSKTLATIKSIEVEGSPDGIFFEAGTERVYVLSHRAPNVTVIDAKEGTVVGTIDVGGAPEQAASDGTGHVFIDVEDKDNIAVIDAKTLKVTGHYSLQGKGGTPAGLAMDVKNNLLFVCCRNPATCVVLDAKDGTVVTTLPIGAGTDGATFNPQTMEAFSSQRDGTLTVIKETSATQLTVEQNLETKIGAKTCTLDRKSNRLYLITAEFGPPPPTAAGGRPGRGAMVPDSFSIIEVAGR